MSFSCRKNCDVISSFYCVILFKKDFSSHEKDLSAADRHSGPGRPSPPAAPPAPPRCPPVPVHQPYEVSLLRCLAREKGTRIRRTIHWASWTPGIPDGNLAGTNKIPGIPGTSVGTPCQAPSTKRLMRRRAFPRTLHSTWPSRRRSRRGRR